MKVSCTIVAVAALFVSTAVVADLVVEDGQVRAPIPGAASTAAYVTLRNPGSEDLQIERVTTTAAASVTLHNTMNHNGMLHMMGMESLTVPASGVVVLQEGGMHMMLEGPLDTLQHGTTVEFTLYFTNGSEQSISLPVRSVLAR